jgi:hypothetical protein
MPGILSQEAMLRADVVARKIIALLLQEEKLEAGACIAALGAAAGIIVGQMADNPDSVATGLNLAESQMRANAMANFLGNRGVEVTPQTLGLSDGVMSVGSMEELMRGVIYSPPPPGTKPN